MSDKPTKTEDRRPNRSDASSSSSRWCGTSRPAGDTARKTRWWKATRSSLRGSGRATRRKDLNLIGKPHPAMPEVGIPRLTGKAEYATRVNLPNMLWVKLLTSPHPRARVKTLDVSKAEKMPGVAYVLTAAECAEDLSLSRQNSSFRAKLWPSWPRTPRIRLRTPLRRSGRNMTFFLSRPTWSKPRRRMRRT